MLDRFVQNLKRLQHNSAHLSKEKCRQVFSTMSDSDFKLLWDAHLLDLSYQYSRKGKLGEERSDGLSGKYDIRNFKPISGESST